MNTRFRLPLFYFLLIVLFCWTLPGSAQQAISPDQKALASLLEQRFAAYNVAILGLDMPALQKLTTPDLTVVANGKESHPLDGITSILAQQEKLKDVIALRRKTAAQPTGKKYTVTSLVVQGDDATAEMQYHWVQTTTRQTQTIQSTIDHTYSTSWKKVGGEWKLHKVVLLKGTTQHKDLNPPAWVSSFNKAVTLPGKTKADLVKVMGEPTSGGTFWYDYELPILVPQANGTLGSQHRLLRFFLNNSFVGDISFSVISFFAIDTPIDYSKPEFPAAWQVWEYLDMQDAEPETFQVSTEQLKGQLLGANGRPAFYPVLLRCKLKNGVAINLAGYTTEPCLIGTPQFDLNTNRREIHELKRNPAFHWQFVKVATIRTDFAATGRNPTFNEGEYPITEKPK